MPSRLHLYIHHMLSCPELSLYQFRQLYEKYKYTPENCLNIQPSELLSYGWKDDMVKTWTNHQAKFDPDVLWKNLLNQEINLIGQNDELYPESLRQTPDAPALLYIRGSSECLVAGCAIAVVGTRRCSPYGETVTRELVKSLRGQSVQIVSGLAYGIDAAAHQAALDCGLATVAVVAGGLDSNSIYPSRHRQLADKIIAAGGCILSEYPPATPALPHHFLERNRIVAAMSDMTVVVEAPEKSGAMVTARIANDLGRTVGAVPGPVNTVNSAGTLSLIRDGAVMIRNGNDLLAELGLENKTNNFGASASVSRSGQRVIQCLQESGSISATELAESSELTQSELLIALTELELAGIISCHEATQTYTLTNLDH